MIETGIPCLVTTSLRYILANFSMGSVSLIGMIIKVECFNVIRKGHFARECRAPRSKEEEHVQTNMALMAFSDSENEVLFSEEVAVLKREVACKDYEINVLKRQATTKDGQTGFVAVDDKSHDWEHSLNLFRFKGNLIGGLCAFGGGALWS
ncbi:putative ribonuclease H-like domain-containing protein [Tanacetum coccineum]